MVVWMWWRSGVTDYFFGIEPPSVSMSGGVRGGFGGRNEGTNIGVDAYPIRPYTKRKKRRLQEKQ